uniref:Glycosyltransferase involved in cell wall bisynthesis n=1 Tax=Candidatus Kentrum sp. FM TaxID=2126340 RepID=A0A450SS32_9GAMM|nr:MAG: Glycosyltransferase involved in cell wall bisynthesis [Candidatus Kentron sp. FM]VFJ57185.1 MAG: Glycosyltransferase involved in cell wall bisynthesis [Candidatus Kentron sp. FM]VFK17587.1 MAG: Glycosyltransferase involved in cell wall bisynthesis [Candidatus Kentron sp. FM]
MDATGQQPVNRRALGHSPREIRIVHVINNLGVGGTEHLFAKHIRRLTEHYPAFSNRIVVLGREETAHGEYLAMLPVRPVFLGFHGRYRNLPASWRCIGQLRRLLYRAAPDLVHSYLWNADVFTAIAKMGLAIPQVAHIVDRRGDRNARRSMTRWRTRLTGRLLRREGNRFVAVSRASAEHARRQLLLPEGDIVTAHNGIPVEQFSAPERAGAGDRRRLVVGTLSNLSEEKGHRYLIEAFGRLAQGNDTMDLEIAGGDRGTARTELEGMVKRLGLSGRIEFLGRVASAADFYRNIDLFVVPSLYAEGLPTTILEAMAARLPVVVTDVGGASEAIRDGIEGIIVPARDPAALATAMGRLGEAPERRLAMGEAGLRRVKNDFTIEAMTRTIVERVYRPMTGWE